MWPFQKSTAYKDALQSRKSVTIKGLKFRIKKVNPMLDFTADTMPQIFVDYLSRRPLDPKKEPTTEEILRIQKDMKAIITAGLVEPKLVPVGKGDDKGAEPGVTVDDLFRDPVVGYGLYTKIMEHSLKIFGGLKGVFFSIPIRLWLWTRSQRDTDAALRISPSIQGNAQ